MPGILITGGAKRIGAEMARGFAARGFRVVLHYNSSSTEAEALAGELNRTGEICRLVQGDLSDAAAVQRVFDVAEGFLGRVHVLLNNASNFMNDDIFSLSDAKMDAHFAVNLKAPLALAARMAAQDMGGEDALILNMLDNKVLALNPDFFSYTLSKAALHAATEMLAMRFGGCPRVNGIAPAITLISGKQTPENFEKSSRINPLGIQVQPADLVRTALYFWDAKGMTGEVIAVDGGQTLWQLPRDVAFLVKEGYVHG
ncbi:NAD(P)-dependent dehydrogenase (short-subunit alcohol dehydrogenase family) [Rhodobacter viridis]|uniref:NAD(P)-dependent dehydrogenase (Short-subunit alcohol dehydrogenase family) n=1 Tax=Rhodobacter viridis TaxID=1054202 RepID=A0A318U3I0_9RHOB|nr:SDR family oxidoreductase [Rhodobacter viridis]PYF09983.1 NAD(P)-dependent dehydrogenase (short-subunit alcohol dehydrogenase family) [Rhodobacter viridis]